MTNESNKQFPDRNKTKAEYDEEARNKPKPEYNEETYILLKRPNNNVTL